MKNPSNSAEARKIKPVIATFMEAKLSDSDKTLDSLSQQGVAVWSGGWETVGTTVTLGTYQVLKTPGMADRRSPNSKPLGQASVNHHQWKRLMSAIISQL